MEETNFEEQSEDVFEVERILDAKLLDSSQFYLVRWKGYGPDDDTWEPNDNLLTCHELVDNFWKEKKSKEALEKAEKARANTNVKENESFEEKTPKQPTLEGSKPEIFQHAEGQCQSTGENFVKLEQKRDMVGLARIKMTGQVIKSEECRNDIKVAAKTSTSMIDKEMKDVNFKASIKTESFDNVSHVISSTKFHLPYETVDISSASSSSSSEGSENEEDKAAKRLLAKWRDKQRHSKDAASESQQKTTSSQKNKLKRSDKSSKYSYEEKLLFRTSKFNAIEESIKDTYRETKSCVERGTYGGTDKHTKNESLKIEHNTKFPTTPDQIKTNVSERKGLTTSSSITEIIQQDIREREEKLKNTPEKKKDQGAMKEKSISKKLEYHSDKSPAGKDGKASNPFARVYAKSEEHEKAIFQEKVLVFSKESLGKERVISELSGNKTISNIGVHTIKPGSGMVDKDSDISTSQSTIESDTLKRIKNLGGNIKEVIRTGPATAKLIEIDSNTSKQSQQQAIVAASLNFKTDMMSKAPGAEPIQDDRSIKNDVFMGERQDNNEQKISIPIPSEKKEAIQKSLTEKANQEINDSSSSELVNKVVKKQEQEEKKGPYLGNLVLDLGRLKGLVKNGIGTEEQHKGGEVGNKLEDEKQIQVNKSNQQIKSSKTISREEQVSLKSGVDNKAGINEKFEIPDTNVSMKQGAEALMPKPMEMSGMMERSTEKSMCISTPREREKNIDEVLKKQFLPIQSDEKLDPSKTGSGNSIRIDVRERGHLAKVNKTTCLDTSFELKEKHSDDPKNSGNVKENNKQMPVVAETLNGKRRESVDKVEKGKLQQSVNKEKVARPEKKFDFKGVLKQKTSSVSEGSLFEFTKVKTASSNEQSLRQKSGVKRGTDEPDLKKKIMIDPLKKARYAYQRQPSKEAFVPAKDDILGGILGRSEMMKTIDDRGEKKEQIKAKTDKIKKGDDHEDQTKLTDSGDLAFDFDEFFVDDDGLFPNDNEDSHFFSSVSVDDIEPVKMSQDDFAIAAQGCEWHKVLSGVAFGMDPDYWDAGGTLLWKAIEGNQYDIAKKLLVFGANVNYKAENGKTALMIAVEKGKAGFVNMLLKAGAYINAQLHNEETALILACRKGHEDIINMLLSHGADSKLIPKSNPKDVYNFAPDYDIPLIKKIIERYNRALAYTAVNILKHCLGNNEATIHPTQLCRCISPGEKSISEFYFNCQQNAGEKGISVLLVCACAEFTQSGAILLHMDRHKDNGVEAVILNKEHQIPVIEGNHSMYFLFPKVGQLNSLTLRTHISGYKLLVFICAVESNESWIDKKLDSFYKEFGIENQLMIKDTNIGVY